MKMRILRGTVFGGIVYFLLGWLLYGILFMDFLSANMNQCANKANGGDDLVGHDCLKSCYGTAADADSEMVRGQRDLLMV